MVTRVLDLERRLSKGASTFLLGARGTGKTHLARAALAKHKHTLTIDLLQESVYWPYLQRPGLLREEVLAAMAPKRERLLVLIDEVQRVPALLNEVHSLMNDYPNKVHFLLTGSSARKLRRAGANMLAGRAYVTHLHPLTFLEKAVPLKKSLLFGGLPGLVLTSADPLYLLEAYTSTYLKEEIQQEALVRRMDSFVRFLDLAAQLHGEPVNFTKMSRQGIASVPTIQEYFSILVDTLVAFRLDGWSESVRKQLLQAPKYYFFDNGVLNALRGELGAQPRESSFRFGKLFETQVILDAIRLNDYADTGYRFSYWRTNTGQEVDLVLSKNARSQPIAVEIKSSTNPSHVDFSGLRAFLSDYPKAKAYCFCRATHRRRVGPVEVVPWQEGLRELFPIA